MAHKMGTGSTQNGRDSQGQRRGVKLFGGEKAQPGSIIVRQCGTKFKAGRGTNMGRDHTIFAIQDGVVQFRNGFIDVVTAPVAPAAK